ncbi:MAG TPA: hypothetical protein VGM68_11095 [Rhizomicrobium sp.]|jgi:hypothetical protein
MDGTSAPEDKQALTAALVKADAYYEALSDEIAALIEAGQNIAPDLLAKHSDAVRAVVAARAALENADE